MGANASRVKSLLDFADAVVLRDVADGAETATAIEASVALNELDAAYWHRGGIPNGVIEVVFNITATAADNAALAAETYVLALLVDDVAAMSDTPVVVWQQTIAPGFTGVIYAQVDSANIPLLDTDSSGTEKYLASRVTLTGDAASITYGAYITKSRRP